MNATTEVFAVSDVGFTSSVRTSSFSIDTEKPAAVLK
jgi:hypothetical protein